MHSQPIDFRHTVVAKHPERLSQIRYLLADSGLGLDNDITLFVEAWSGSQLVGCAGLAANVIKCVAVNEQLRGENLSARLLAEVENAALECGHFHLFLCTRPCNRERFARSGFWPIAQSGNNAVLMENTPQGIERYCRSLRAKRKCGENIGAIVMNANPFTLGHRHLVEQAAQRCDALHLFVVREDASFFPFSARLEMVRAGVAHLPNVVVHEGSQYIISRATFPAYFLKETGKVQQAWSEIDVLIFRDFIAPALGITHASSARSRFAISPASTTRRCTTCWPRISRWWKCRASSHRQRYFSVRSAPLTEDTAVFPDPGDCPGLHLRASRNALPCECGSRLTTRNLS